MNLEVFEASSSPWNRLHYLQDITLEYIPWITLPECFLWITLPWNTLLTRHRATRGWCLRKNAVVWCWPFLGSAKRTVKNR